LKPQGSESGREKKRKKGVGRERKEKGKKCKKDWEGSGKHLLDQERKGTAKLGRDSCRLIKKGEYRRNPPAEGCSFLRGFGEEEKSKGGSRRVYQKLAQLKGEIENGKGKKLIFEKGGESTFLGNGPCVKGLTSVLLTRTKGEGGRKGRGGGGKKKRRAQHKKGNKRFGKPKRRSRVNQGNERNPRG